METSKVYVKFHANSLSMFNWKEFFGALWKICNAQEEVDANSHVASGEVSKDFLQPKIWLRVAAWLAVFSC